MLNIVAGSLLFPSVKDVKVFADGLVVAGDVHPSDSELAVHSAPLFVLLPDDVGQTAGQDHAQQLHHRQHRAGEGEDPQHLGDVVLERNEKKRFGN